MMFLCLFLKGTLFWGEGPLREGKLWARNRGSFWPLRTQAGLGGAGGSLGWPVPHCQN